MFGMSIQGTGRRDGKPFAIELGDDGVAEVKKSRSGELEGTTHRETGKWWAENYRFCMQFTRFGQGRKLCPRIVRDGAKITATRGDGTQLDWSFTK